MLQIIFTITALIFFIGIIAENETANKKTYLYSFIACALVLIALVITGRCA
jgi:hypothetical protein